MNLKEIFEKSADENGMLSYDQFEAIAKESGAKFADLSDGKYVSKSKYDADLKAKDTQIENINSQIESLNQTVSTRDEDLKNLQKQLEDAGQDATKLSELNTQFNALQQQYDERQKQYDAQVKSYEDKMQKQAYEFAVKEFASTKQFSSNAAKRDFIKTMLEKNLQMEDGKILGREDFAEKYAEENSDAFMTELSPEDVNEIFQQYGRNNYDDEPDEPEDEPVAVDIPQFVGATPGPEPQDEEFDFGFQGVRAH